MKVFYISPVHYNTADLFVSFGFEEAHDVKEATVAFFDFHTRREDGDYDQQVLDAVVESKIPVVTFDDWDRGAMSNDIWPYPMSEQQEQFFDKVITGKSVHFVRKFDKTINYPTNVYPIEKCITEDFPPTSADELFSRAYDVCLVANGSDSRRSVINGIKDDGRLKTFIYWSHEQERGKLPVDEWFDLHRASKLFLSVDGASLGDERCLRLFSVAAILKQRNNHLQPSPLTEFKNCLMVSEHPTKEEITNIIEVLNDKEYLYEIYEAGINHMKTYYTEEYRANYILKILLENGIN